MAVEYPSSPLKNANDIRVFILHPGTFKDDIHVSLYSISLDDNTLSYEAISYVWGDPSDTKAITCNTKSFHITTNLESCLRHLRSETGSRTLWADAICINQQDGEEKGHQ